MFDFNTAQGLDIKSVRLDKEEPDRNIYEFDLTLWSLLCNLAKTRPDEVVSQFSISMDTVVKLSYANSSQLARLASGVLLSFKPEISDKDIIAQLGKKYDPVVFINHTVNEFDSAYWLLLNRVACRDHERAREIFGVSKNIAEMVSKATDNQLRYLSRTTVIPFSLRFSPAIIEQILDDSRKEPAYPVLKKLQQSLQHSRRWA